MKKIIALVILIFAFVLLCSCDRSEPCNHEPGEYLYQYRPTCTEPGRGTLLCAKCHAPMEENAEIPAFGHNIVVRSGYAPTCNKSGATDEEYCPECGTITKPSTSIPSLGHKYENWICIHCGASSLGALEFTLTQDGQGYTVSRGTYADSTIVIPETYEGKPVVAIAESGFTGDGITSITIPSSVKIIGANAFKNATFTELVLPDSIEEIGEYAFFRCDRLTEIRLGKNVKTVGKFAFASCKALTKVVFDTACPLAEIPQNCFDNSLALASVTLPASLKTIGKRAFVATALTELVLPDGLVYIDENAFAGIKTLEEIRIPNSVQGLGYCAFSDCRLKKVILPFIGASRTGTPYTDTDYRNNTTALSYVFSTGSLLYLEVTDTEKIPASSVANCPSLLAVVLHNGVRIIENSAFANCRSLVYVALPATLTSIERSAFSAGRVVEIRNDSGLNITPGSGEYGNLAAGARHIYNADSTSHLGLVDGSFVFYRGVGNYLLLKYIGTEQTVTTPKDTSEPYIIYDYAFEGTAITSVTVCNATAIGYSAFGNCKSLVNVTFEENSALTSIGAYAFYGCSQLLSFSFPQGVTEIKESTFENCTALYDVNIHLNIVRIDNPFEGCTNLGLDLPNSLEFLYLESFRDLKNAELVDGIYYVDGWAVGCDFDTVPASVTLRDGTVGIAKHTFYYNGYNITELTIPTSVKHISDGALSGCSSVTRLTVPFLGASATDTREYPLANMGLVYAYNSTHGTLEYVAITLADFIPDRAFAGFTALKNVSVCASVKSIGAHAFEGCSALTGVDFAGDSRLTVLGERAFANCISLGSVAIPSGVTVIPDGCFYGCTSIDGVIMGEGITSIGAGAFSGCTRLSAVVLPQSLVSVGAEAFYNCTALSVINYRGSETAWNAMSIPNTAYDTGRVTVRYNYAQ